MPQIIPLHEVEGYYPREESGYYPYFYHHSSSVAFPENSGILMCTNRKRSQRQHDLIYYQISPEKKPEKIVEIKLELEEQQNIYQDQ